MNQKRSIVMKQLETFKAAILVAQQTLFKLSAFTLKETDKEHFQAIKGLGHRNKAKPLTPCCPP